jgi:hypothetical protein
MTNEHRTTPEEEAYGRILNEKWETLSEAARTVVSEARTTAYGAFMVHNYNFQGPIEYGEAMEKMRLAAVELTEDECRLLSKIWHAALAAAASVDADDFESLAGYRVYSGDLHRYYRMLSGMIEEILQEKKFEEAQRELAEQEPIDYTDIPF